MSTIALSVEWSFNPIKVLFLHRSGRSGRYPPPSFNPIKVLFLQKIFHFSRIVRLSLSILSRFYFYDNGFLFLPGCPRLSILSRFYFYKLQQTIYPDPLQSFNPIKVLFLLMDYGLSMWTWSSFQSYQGSIFTDTVGVRFSSALAFNPIKVLFLLWRVRGTVWQDPLSILSRFYFYY